MTQLIDCSIPRIVISGLRGGSGKTILSVSLIALWLKKGIKVTPFKKGPDYIDAGWLAQAAGEPCFNLDLFMMQPHQVVQSFISHTRNTQIAVIEGNRGLYDGVDYEGTYSTAELAKLLGSPVIIIVDCTKATGTIAAVILGCQRLDPEVSIRGVVLNNVANSRQERLIRKAINKKCSLPVIGALPRLKKDLFPERHMGLTPFHEHLEVERAISAIVEFGAKYIDIESVWMVANEAEALEFGTRDKRQETRDKGQETRDKGQETRDKRQGTRDKGQETRDKGQGTRDKGQETRDSVSKQTLTLKTDTEAHLSLVTCHSSLKIGVIKDSAFQFYYPENFEELEKQGAELIEISALKAERLPDLDALYIGGGFPETHAVKLAENEAFKKSLYKAIEGELPVYAECGGLMYLSESLVLNNKKYPMVGVFPLIFTMGKNPQAHGYTIIEVEKTNPYFLKGYILKGHEFHYSRVIEIKGERNFMAFKVKRGKGIKDGMDGICYKNVLATYTHLHALGSPEWIRGMIITASRFRDSKH